MRLADYIDQHLPLILEAWESFAAAQLPAAAHMDSLGLRDHAQEILRAISDDLRTAQSAIEQHTKALGQVVRPVGLPNTAAQTHAVLRATAGFTLPQLVVEYRALRACVLQLWLDSRPVNAELLADTVRFNEAIDQALAESVDFFSQEVKRWRYVFLGMLGHDLRNPLNVILLTSQALAKLTDGTAANAVTQRLMSSGWRMQELLDDLLDYSRGEMGLGIRVQRLDADLYAVCEEELALQRLAHPDAEINLSSSGPTRGKFDASRIRQVIANLVSNAVKHGDSRALVSVELHGSVSSCELRVSNHGPTIPASDLEHLFNPFRRLRLEPSEAHRSSMGLGLFIVKQIAVAHGGSVSMASADGLTTCSVQLPLSPAAS